MQIKILFFGIVKDIINLSEMDYFIDNDTTIAILQDKILKEYPKLKDLKKFAFAVNESFVENTHVLKEKDIVAIIPPVSGG